jgi:hypothetical protein
MRKTKYEYGVTYRRKHAVSIAAQKRADGANNAARNRKRRQDNPDEIKAMDRLRKTTNRAQYLLNHAKSRAKRLGQEFAITYSDLPPIGLTCPILGIEYNQAASHSTKDFSPSLDRIDSSRGYVVGNVQIISWRANRLKSNGTLEEFKRIVSFLQSKEP